LGGERGSGGRPGKNKIRSPSILQEQDDIRRRPEDTADHEKKEKTPFPGGDQVVPTKKGKKNRCRGDQQAHIKTDGGKTREKKHPRIRRKTFLLAPWAPKRGGGGATSTDVGKKGTLRFGKSG